MITASRAGDQSHSSILHRRANVCVCVAAAAPRVLVGYRRLVEQRAGSTVRLECPVRAEPSALVSWSKDQHDVNIAWDRFRVVAIRSTQHCRELVKPA